MTPPTPTPICAYSDCFRNFYPAFLTSIPVPASHAHFRAADALAASMALRKASQELCSQLCSRLCSTPAAAARAISSTPTAARMVPSPLPPTRPPGSESARLGLPRGWGPAGAGTGGGGACRCAAD